MENITGISQLFRNLCQSSDWSYAILWKLQETTQMLLACEDAYVSATKSHVTMEYSPCTGFFSSDPMVATFGCESNARTGDIPGCSIEVVISDILRYCYFLGEGIVGITALTEKHKWISLWGLKSRLSLEYLEELQLQVAAGIKTIVLVPVLPLGVVQLGSLYELSEDLKMVAHIKDLFLTYHQYTLELQSTFNLETDNGTALGRPMIQNCSACFATAGEFTDPSNFQPVSMQDWTNLNYDEVIEDDFLSQLMTQPYDPLPQDELGTDSSEVIWDEMCPECSTEQVVINSSINTVSTLVDDQSILSYRSEEIGMIPVISNCLAPEDPIISDNECTYDLYHIDDSCLGFGEEFDVVTDSITDGMFLTYPGEAIQSSSLFEFDDSALIAKQSEANELSNSISIFEVEVPQPVEEPAGIMKDNSADYLPDALLSELHILSDDKDLESSGCQNSSITQCKGGDMMDLEVSIPGIHRMPSLISNTEGYTIHLMTVQNNSDQQDMEQKLQKGSSKQGKKRRCRRPRPRDRQLIQDRITELRELIPNGSKCSIDELLERAVTYMMFLESVPAHAEKLNKSKSTKVGKDSKNHEKSLPQNESSLACELETKRNNLPLIIENPEQPDQMLIEVQCRDYGLFLDTTQAFKRLKLTILEGTLQSRSTGQQWAHFIVQVPDGFNRMDILWPLMRLLEFKF